MLELPDYQKVIKQLGGFGHQVGGAKCSKAGRRSYLPTRRQCQLPSRPTWPRLLPLTDRRQRPEPTALNTAYPITAVYALRQIFELAIPLAPSRRRSATTSQTVTGRGGLQNLRTLSRKALARDLGGQDATEGWGLLLQDLTRSRRPCRECLGACELCSVDTDSRTKWG